MFPSIRHTHIHFTGDGCFYGDTLVPDDSREFTVWNIADFVLISLMWKSWTINTKAQVAREGGPRESTDVKPCHTRFAFVISHAHERANSVSEEGDENYSVNFYAALIVCQQSPLLRLSVVTDTRSLGRLWLDDETFSACWLTTSQLSRIGREKMNLIKFLLWRWNHAVGRLCVWNRFHNFTSTMYRVSFSFVYDMMSVCIRLKWSSSRGNENW